MTLGAFLNLRRWFGCGETAVLPNVLLEQQSSEITASGIVSSDTLPFCEIDPEMWTVWVGSVLYQVICGAFLARGSSLHRWCSENDIKPHLAREAIFGRRVKVQGRLLLKRIIDAAGRDLVRDAYARRLAEHARQFTKGAA